LKFARIAFTERYLGNRHFLLGIKKVALGCLTVLNGLFENTRIRLSHLRGEKVDFGSRECDIERLFVLI
jgi:hypothetical protein